MEVSMESQQFISKRVEKRSGSEWEDDYEPTRKRVKLRDLESVIRSEEMASHYLGSSKTKAKTQIETVENEVSKFTQELLNPNHGSLDETGLYKKSSTLQADHTVLISLDLNSEVCIDENSACDETVAETNAKCQADNEKKSKALGCRGLDLNEDASSTVGMVPFYQSFKNHSDTKAKDAWECGSSTGPVENTSLQKWVEMKQNGFLTPNYGSIPRAPKQRMRKSKTEVLKRKMEQARKEQVDKFTRIAAPSGLLNGLNPGIINHVRNSKQVHSIIQALVIERGERSKDLENSNSWIHRSSVPHGSASCNIVSDSKYTNDDPLALKLASSAMMVSEKASSFSMEEPVNAEDVDSLSVKAANVASQWLQLLCQDIKGRLAALKRSKRRVQDVITTELPFLLSKELLSKQGNDFYATSNSISGCSRKATVELHRTRWIMLFNQMEQGLTKEEKELESQLNQVNNMMAHCEKGLEYLQCKKAFGLPLLGATEKGCRSGTNEPDGKLAMKAAAASIYSTCSFALSTANVKCY